MRRVPVLFLLALGLLCGVLFMALFGADHADPPADAVPQSSAEGAVP